MHAMPRLEVFLEQGLDADLFLGSKRLASIRTGTHDAHCAAHGMAWVLRDDCIDPVVAKRLFAEGRSFVHSHGNLTKLDVPGSGEDRHLGLCAQHIPARITQSLGSGVVGGMDQWISGVLAARYNRVPSPMKTVWASRNFELAGEAVCQL